MEKKNIKLSIINKSKIRKKKKKRKKEKKKIFCKNEKKKKMGGGGGGNIKIDQIIVIINERALTNQRVGTDKINNDMLISVGQGRL